MELLDDIFQKNFEIQNFDIFNFFLGYLNMPHVRYLEKDEKCSIWRNWICPHGIKVSPRAIIKALIVIGRGPRRPRPLLSNDETDDWFADPVLLPAPPVVALWCAPLNVGKGGTVKYVYEVKLRPTDRPEKTQKRTRAKNNLLE